MFLNETTKSKCRWPNICKTPFEKDPFSNLNGKLAGQQVSRRKKFTLNMFGTQMQPI